MEPFLLRDKQKAKIFPIPIAPKINDAVFNTATIMETTMIIPTIVSSIIFSFSYRQLDFFLQGNQQRLPLG